MLNGVISDIYPFFLERANITEISLNNEPSVVNNGSAGPVDEFRSLTLTCSATGKPVPSILWLRDGVTIGGSSRHTITSRNSTTGSGKLLTISTLMVSQVILADEGMYTCRAVSGDVSPIPGQTAWTFQLDVQRECHACMHDQRCMRTNVHIAIDVYTYVLVLLLSPQLQLEMNVSYGTLAIA